jgi:aarF domain-containing kinase
LQVLSTKYDPQVLQQFFERRPFLVWGRLAEIIFRSLALYLRTLIKHGPKRSVQSSADELCTLLASLGPTFIKLGQTLSTREDIVGKDLARTLSGLQMSAPPFEDALAHEVIRLELHGEPEDLYADFSGTHVAAASLGQVYQGKLPQERLSTSAHPCTVAIKVQRPNMLGSIALDVYTLRLGLGLVRKLAKINSDLRKIADEVGSGLFAELDYRVEAAQVH